MDGGYYEFIKMADLPESLSHGVALHCGDCNLSMAFTST